MKLSIKLIESGLIKRKTSISSYRWEEDVPANWKASTLYGGEQFCNWPCFPHHKSMRRLINAICKKCAYLWPPRKLSTGLVLPNDWSKQALLFTHDASRSRCACEHVSPDRWAADRVTGGPCINRHTKLYQARHARMIIFSRTVQERNKQRSSSTHKHANDRNWNPAGPVAGPGEHQNGKTCGAKRRER